LSFARCHIKLLREPGTLALVVVVDVGLASEMEREREEEKRLFSNSAEKQAHGVYNTQRHQRVVIVLYEVAGSYSARLLCCTQYMECNTLGCTQLSVAERRPGNKLISNCVHRSFPLGFCCARSIFLSHFLHTAFASST
jgi:hypothetical protein